MAQTYHFTREAKTGGRVIDEGSTQNGDYPAGTSITVIAEADPEYEFIGWMDADNKALFETTKKTFSTPLTKNLTLTAHFLPLYTVTATSSDEKIGKVSPLQPLIALENGTYLLENGTYLIEDYFTTAPAPGYIVKWKREGSDDPITDYYFTIDKASVVLVAYFVQLFPVTATSDAAMGTVLPSSLPKELENGTYPIEDHFTTTAKDGYIFVKWTDKDSDAPITEFTIDEAPVDLVAHFVREDDPNALFPVTATSNDETMGTVSPPFRDLESETYLIETYFPATPEEGYILYKWTYKGSDEAITKFTIDKKQVDLVAHFILDRFTVTATSNDETMGTVSPPSQELENGPHPIGTFTFELKPGYIFDKWTYKDSDDAIITNFEINKAQVDLVAHFIPDPSCIPFDQIVAVRYNNVLMIKNTETVESVKWFKNDEEIKGTGDFYYSAGDKHGDELNEDAAYRVEITPTDGDVLCSCPKQLPLRPTGFSSPLQAYPNPVKKGSLITIEGIPKEVKSIIIYDIAGRVAARHDLTAIHKDSEAIPMPATEGIYLIKVGGKTLKVVVE
ncbi:hypothetical protein AGMMS4957_20400 [Bacteroidia bacterium]|nr:hypothetical protein AGMMS4957_20400 [Bacteroidia bacterium]